MVVLLPTSDDCNFTNTEPIFKIRYALERGDPNSLISGVFCPKLSRRPTKKWGYIMEKSRKPAFTAPSCVLVGDFPDAYTPKTLFYAELAVYVAFGQRKTS